jgi:ABC-type Fe3+/spermidine/putrescine transport system ATPase subunit
VESFLGRSNAFTATVTDSEPLTIDLGTETITLETTSKERSAGDRVRCHVRPDALSVRPPDADGSTPSLAGVVTRVSDLGRRYDVSVQADVGPEFIVERADSPPAVDDRVAVTLPERELIIFDA